MFWHPDTKACPSISSRLFSVSPGKEVGVWMCKLDVISQERLKIDVKLLWSAKEEVMHFIFMANKFEFEFEHVASIGTTTDDLE